MTYRTRFEKEKERVDSLMEQISEQSTLVAKLLGRVSRSVERAIDANGSLHKAAEYTEQLATTMGIVDQIQPEIKKLTSLQDEARDALDRARDAFPSYEAWVSNMATVPLPAIGGGQVFLAQKGGDVARLPTSEAKPADPRASLSDVMLSRRFQK